MSTAEDAVQALSRDLKNTASLLGRKQARALTDAYYQMQRFRTAAKNQVRQCERREPKDVIEWFASEFTKIENNLRRALGHYASGYRTGEWLQSICGIGPVISAGLISHFDIREARTVGHFWRFAGLDPTQQWNKKEKRPWNAALKTLIAFKAGESFIKKQNNKKDFYGAIFRKKKDEEIERNGRGEFAKQAAHKLDTVRIGKATEAYKWYSDGKLPPAHLNARARRYAAKMFTSHVHHIMHLDYFGTKPPLPYSFEHCPGDHRHFIEPPNLEVFKASEGRPLSDLFALDKDDE